MTKQNISNKQTNPKTQIIIKKKKEALHGKISNVRIKNLEGTIFALRFNFHFHRTLFASQRSI